ncbi:histidine--tRNA ligase [Paraliomyxa miuraensis]|uniref:histidine--tRNA ligase n=1 Tax=Paraliomyxa miuraensis TaxID=376150 RepID=UPI00224EA92C|nr:histidine--tRNA ligase [Paraliomyxa miuraensis]MCX4242890.1 histidine--tRNA ligase [Paraliomyxa miuraensis]
MKIRPISGFPEWLPEQRIVEQALLDQVRRNFELFGFRPVQTRAVEELDRLAHKGSTDKEIYAIRRLHADPDETDDKLGLHFDLTVPFARYTLENRGQLVFPFKRYQIQKVWRGERPQEGRYREFYQADIDVIGQDSLPLCFDAEMPLLIHAVTSSLPLPPVRVHVGHRKVLEGFYRGVGLPDITPVLRIVDKLAKIGPDEVRASLVSEAGLGPDQAERCLALSQLRGGLEVIEQVRALGVEHELLETGLGELHEVLSAAAELPPGSVVADLGIARGFDYYTGTVYEAFLQGLESIGAVCSGGRYDNLADAGDAARFPGVGVSLGITRLLGPLFRRDALVATRRTPTCVLVALDKEQTRSRSQGVAARLRARGIPTEVFHAAHKYGKQIKYADKLGIPFVWFCGDDEGNGQIRDIRSGEQVEAHADQWEPTPDDRWPRVERPS